ncbi:hypothetical protein [Paenibacillus agricola]|uniref:hypothetical protein n=1 Tax=Paenibacillus agricola TaxID=2716264 RepID=UPI001A9D3CE1|nr:hypothetical protein [Paenibacillus agricola]
MREWRTDWSLDGVVSAYARLPSLRDTLYWGSGWKDVGVMRMLAYRPSGTRFTGEADRRRTVDGRVAWQRGKEAKRLSLTGFLSWNR